MSAFFWILFGVYHAVVIARNVRGTARGPRRAKPAFWFQSLLMVAAVWAANEYGALSRDLVNPVYAAAGLLIGYLVHGMSLLATNLAEGGRGIFAGLREYFGAREQRGAYFAQTPEVFFMLIMNSVGEELIYRAAAQPLLAEAVGPWAAVVLVALLFSAGHWHFMRGRPMESAEFLAYALLLGGLYYWTGSLILVIVAHTVRNFELHFQSYLLKREDVEDDEAAIAAAEEDLRRSVQEPHWVWLFLLYLGGLLRRKEPPHSLENS